MDKTEEKLTKADKNYKNQQKLTKTNKSRQKPTSLDQEFGPAQAGPIWLNRNPALVGFRNVNSKFFQKIPIIDKFVKKISVISSKKHDSSCRRGNSSKKHCSARTELEWQVAELKGVWPV